MREKLLYEAVDRKLPKSIHTQSMTGASSTMNGTPDRYYDGPKKDLWVEYKQFDSWPRNGVVCCAPVPGKKKQPKGHLSVLQLDWLVRRHTNGRNVAVVAGLPDRTAVVMTEPHQWLKGVSIGAFRTRQEVAEWIIDFCGG